MPGLRIRVEQDTVWKLTFVSSIADMTRLCNEGRALCTERRRKMARIPMLDTDAGHISKKAGRPLDCRILPQVLSDHKGGAEKWPASVLR